MAQQLIVEGKDSFVIANLCMKRGLKPPKGYNTREKFKEFIIDVGGVSKVNTALEETLIKTDITNIGIIVDANTVGPQARFSSLKQIIEGTLDIFVEDNLTENGAVFQPFENLTIGIWIMPDNISTGYLEHFVTQLIHEGDKTWIFTKEKVDELMRTDFYNFTEVKKQKALMHTWLAWQKEPGLPMGLAIKTKYLDALSPNADNFIKWFENAFELEE